MKKLNSLFVAALCLVGITTLKAQTGIITTITGGNIFANNNVAATATELYSPLDMIQDASGNTYVAMGNGQCVIKINTSGIISVVAGQYNNPGYSGNGGQATAAKFYDPCSLALDASGNLYIDDQNNQVIRKVNTSGVVSVYAGNGTMGFSGNGGQATSAMLCNPGSITMDATGNLYIAENCNFDIRKVSTSGVITNYAGIAGFRASGFSGDGGQATSAEIGFVECMRFNSAGDMFIADYYNGEIRKINHTTGVITDYAGVGVYFTPAGFSGDGGQATNAHFTECDYIAFDATGNLYISDIGNQNIRKVTTSGIISTVAGLPAKQPPPGFSGNGGAATAAELYNPYGVLVNSAGNLLIADQQNYCIREVNTSNVISTLYGGSYGDGNVATNAFFGLIGKAVKDAAGNVYVTDYGSSRVRKINTSGIISTIAGIGECPNYGAGYNGDGIQATAAELNQPYSQAVDAAGNVYIADYTNNRVRKINTSGIISTIAGNGTGGYTGFNVQATTAELNLPADVVLDASGNIYIADYNNNVVRKVNTSGVISNYAGNGTGGYTGFNVQATTAELNGPIGLGFDASGNLYIVDGNNQVIRKVTTSGIITTVAGNGTAGYSGDGGQATSANLNYPNGVCVDASNNMYIADFSNNVVRKVNTSGIISTIAGKTTAGYSGDGGQATAAEMNGPDDVFADTHNNIYIGDYYNSAIRRIQGTCTVVEAAPTLNSDVICNGGTGSATAATATGGVSPYSYQWNTGTTSTNTLNAALTAATYTVFVTDAAGCTATSSGTVAITQPAALADGTPTHNSDASCHGGNGSATAATPTGGTSPYTYQWNGGTSSTNATNAALSAGTYTVNVTDAHGCTVNSSGTVTITAPASALADGTPTHNSDASCHGGNGSATAANPTGGTSPYTYAWNGGTTSTNATNAALTAATYTVNVTDNHGCTANSSGTVTITAPASALADGTPTHNSDASCHGGNGSATAATPTGGTSPYTYAWNGGTTSTNATNAALTAATYTVNVTDNHGCTVNSSGTVTITAPTALADGTPTHNSDVTCNGGNNGSATAAAPSGGTSPYTYAWNGGTTSTNATNSSLSAGTYTVNVTDNHGCTANSSGTVTITAPASALADGTPTHNSDASCHGGNGSATAATPTGGTSPYTYQWNGGSSSTNATNAALTAGTYTVNVTDNHGCTVNSSGTVTITAPTTLTDGTPTHNSDANCSGGNGSATAATPTGGTAPYTYAWNGGATSTNLTNAALSAGTYTVNVTDNHGCTVNSSGTVTITAPTTLTDGTPTHNSDANCSGGNGSATAATPTGGTAPYTYQWNGGASNTNQTNSSLSAGTYTVNVTDNHGCTVNSSGTVTITAPTTLTDGAPTHNSDANCSGGNGSATAATPTGGTAPYTYQWNGGASNTNPTNSSLSAGTYTVNVTDNHGCTVNSSGTVTITAPTTLTDGAPTHNSDANCSGGNGNATAATPTGGTAPYTYQWNGGATSTNATNSTLSAGTYTVNITDNHGCTVNSSGTITITAPSALTDGTPIHNSDVTCNGGNNGSATAATPTGGTSPYTYQWNGGASNTNPTNSSLSAGTYTVNVTDNHGCTVNSSGTVTITAPATALAANASVTANVNCNGNNTGSAQSAPSGGTSPYTYSWQGGETTSSISSVTAGTYTLTVQDNQGCNATGSVIITQPSSGLSTTASVSQHVYCNGYSTGNANATPSGGTSPYTYSWSNGTSTVSTANPTGGILGAGSYTVTVQDNGGCSASASITITQTNPVIPYWWTTHNISCFGGSNGQATSAVLGGTMPYTYLWSDGNTNGSRTNLPANTTYTFTATDANGCYGSTTLTLTQPAAALTETITKNSDLTCHSLPPLNNPNGSATSNPNGGTSPYIFVWTPSGGSLQTSLTLPAGTDNCKVIDANGCIATSSVTLTQPGVIFATFVKTLPSCNGNSDGAITASGTGGAGGYAYVWAPYGGNAATATNLSAQIYTVTVTDNLGCSGTAGVGLGQPAIIGVAIPTFTCVAGGKGTVVANATGGTPGYHYTWSNGTSTVGILKTETFVNGSYTVTVTDNFGCPGATANTTINGCPTIKTHGEDNVDNIGDNNLNDITIYPNPTNGQFTIQWSVVSDQWSVEIYNVLGQNVYSQSAIHEQQSSFNLSNQPNGIYLIRILDKEGNLVGMKKVMKTN